MDIIEAELVNFERIVPYADEATMVLKAHLLLEQSLWKFIALRITDEKLVNDLRNEHSNVGTGKALIQLAQAVAARDEVPITNGEILWPMLKKINLLRNRFVHDLEPSRERVEALMREIVRGVLGTVPSDQLSRDFYHATKLLLGYLAIDRAPMGLSDTE